MSTKPTVMIVDDERNTRDGLRRALEPEYNIHLAQNGRQALDLLEEHPVDLVLSDIRMPGMDGMTLLRRIRARREQPVCILLTAYGSIETAVQAMKEGAYDYLTKPVNLDELELTLQRALQARRMENENADLRQRLDERYGMEGFIGRSQPMQQVYDVIRQAAPSRATVLLQGESGTGKDLAAQALHQLSPRARAPFVPVHCAALSETLLESELFGHEKGAFTGAVARRKGRFEIADGGTLFLDEIGEISPAVQVKILRVLEERCFERVGGHETIEVDVRLLAATNCNLKQMVEDGKFREDLFYRLHVVVIEMPALRDRREDIPLLAEHFLRHFAEENGKSIDGLTSDALNQLVSHEWPGNVRQLRNTIERMVVMARGPRLTVRDLPDDIRSASPACAVIARPGSSGSLQQAERDLIVRALEDQDGNRTRAARQLGISRRTLHRKLNQYGLHDKDDNGGN